MSSLLASVRPESLIPAIRVRSAGSRVLTPLSFGSERQQSLGRHRSGSTPPARGKAPAEVSHWTRVLQKTRLLQPVTRTESFQVHLRPLLPVEERPCVPGARGHVTTQHVCPCGGESGICRPLSPRPQAAAHLPVRTRFSAALTGPASPRGSDVQLPTCSQGCGGSRGGPSGSLSGRLRARPCSPLKTGVLATGTSARGLIGRRALQRRSSPSDVPGDREPIRRGPDRRGTVGTEPDTHQGAAGLPAHSGGRGGEPPGGGLRHDAPDAPRPAVTRTRDPVSFSLPARVIGSGARSGDTLPRGLPPAGSPVPPGAARGACRPLGLVCAGHEGQGQRALCRASSSLRPSRRQAQRRACGTHCPARARPCHQVVTRQQSICHWQMPLTARASCPRVDRAIRDLIAAGAARCLPCGRLALVSMATWLCPGRDTCPSVAVERSAHVVPVLC